MTLLRPSPVLGVVILILLGVASGCDLAGEDTDLRPLVGSWQATDLSVDGISVKAQLDAQYDRLVLTLREGAEGGEYFTIIGREDGNEEDLFVQGTFDADADELNLFPESSPQIEFDYAVSDSVAPRLQLSAEEGASEDLFIDLLHLPIQGAVDRLELRLSKGFVSTEGAPARPDHERTARASRPALFPPLATTEQSPSQPGSPFPALRPRGPVVPRRSSGPV